MKQISIIIFFFILPLAFADLELGFYASSCRKAESIVKQVVQKRFNRDKSITAALLRMHFHDCFVRGCDASLLIDSTKNNISEKDTGANDSVRGYDLIDDVKEAIEAACPSTVSCADIVALATRDAVALSGGPKYNIPTGRRDGLIANRDDVDLPGPNIPIGALSQFFAAKGITTEEMVTLLGAHTVGVAHCGFFASRLSSVRGKPDPTMDPALDTKLVKLCKSNSDGAAFLDQNTSFTVDNEFYKQILLKRGIMQIDQQLALDKSTSTFVSNFASNGDKFVKSFATAMIKMGKVGVLVGNEGEIRKNCRVFNKRN
ncbi:putative peroxidase [Medicago truncatula]|uniref:Peroxidase n=1 Tax=Medicago truncatula TaxID=3880 RepID=A2Q4B7_MEDTR|nr:Haem peroxidase, plant/fungal/bacterial [Medicago truncatula]AES80947.1 peroxidase family protein [Medicago truncatula]RHN47551.1 putative peroxidase [Medicago truncatula]